MPKHFERLQNAVDGILADRTDLEVLEAGCGSMSFLDLGSSATITGIDISEQQLNRNSLLHKAICGDITTHEFPADSFDAVICFDVLEHLDRPDLALENFENYLAPGGLMILKFPNVWSIKGLMTKFTPHWFHVWFYRSVLGRPNAGKNDTAPFPTYLRTSIGPPAMRRWGTENRLNVVYEDFYESNYQTRLKRKFVGMSFCLAFLESLISFISLGRLSFEKTEFIIVLQKPALS